MECCGGWIARGVSIDSASRMTSEHFPRRAVRILSRAGHSNFNESVVLGTFAPRALEFLLFRATILRFSRVLTIMCLPYRLVRPWYTVETNAFIQERATVIVKERWIKIAHRY